MYGETEELFFINNDYGGPYWDRSNQVAQRSYANSPHKFVSKWDTPILIFTGEYDFRIPYTVARSLHGSPRARHPGAAGGIRKRGAPGLQTPELARLEPRILRLARQIREITDRGTLVTRPSGFPGWPFLSTVHTFTFFILSFQSGRHPSNRLIHWKNPPVH